MDKNVLILSGAETFTVRGLEMKLKGIGVNPSFCALKAKEIEQRIGGTDLFILYSDNISEEGLEALAYLKNFSAVLTSRLIVIGTKPEYESVLRVIPEAMIMKYYDRPLAMEQFLNAMEKHFAQEDDFVERKSILIVDDDVSYMTMIMDWLKAAYHVSIVNSGMHAITWLANNHADLILLDYEMPVTSGPQVLEMIRSAPETAGIPVMFLTGKNDKESIMKVLDLKPTDYLLKTIDRKGLREKVDGFFKS